MKLRRAVFCLWTSVSLFAAGCAEEVGPCPEKPVDGKLPMTKNAGYDTVLVKGGGGTQYAGQAILNQSCAAGGVCHSSLATGKTRNGAPADLDFDLRPLKDADITGTATNSKGNTIATLAPEDISGLRARQRKIFEQRNSIWSQVKHGDMPPDGVFAMFRKLTTIFDTDEANHCTAVTNPFLDITEKPTQDLLRTWLACSTPIVEVNSEVVEVPGSAGLAGYQYDVCESTPGEDGGVGDGGGGEPSVVTLEDLLDEDNGVFVTYACIGCHPGMGDEGIDMSSLDAAYETLVENKKLICNGKPLVTAGDPTKSFLYEVLSEDVPGCGKDPMPLSGPMDPPDLKKVEDWIKGGALKSADKARSLLRGGLDAGLGGGIDAGLR